MLVVGPWLCLLLVQVATSGGKRGAAVARFLGGLADKREQLAARLTKQQQQQQQGGTAPLMGQLE
jgi:hypothetical protein